MYRQIRRDALRAPELEVFTASGFSDGKDGNAASCALMNHHGSQPGEALRPLSACWSRL